MHRATGPFGSLLLESALMLPLATVGCAHHYYTPQKDVYYNHWVTENHRDAHVEYQHLSKEGQNVTGIGGAADHDRDHDQKHE